MFVYIGGYDKEEKAARAYDLAALKYWGTSTTTNFPVSFMLLIIITLLWLILIARFKLNHLMLN